MSVLIPDGIPSLGNIKVQAFLTCANMAAPLTATEVKATTSVDLSFFIRNWSIEITSNTGSAPPRLGTKTQLPQLGQTTIGTVELRYVYAPQEANTTPNNKAKNLLVQGTSVYIAARKGLDAQFTDWAAAQKVEVYKMTCGPQNRVTSGDANDEFGEFEISQILVPSSLNYQLDAVLAA